MDYSLISGILAGVIVGILSWIIHLVTNTPPWISISKKICKDDRDNCYRIKIRNNGLANVKIVSANFIISYSPNPAIQITKNDILLEGKEDPLLFGLLSEICKKNTLRTFDTFVLDAQRIRGKTIESKTSERFKEKYKSGKLTVGDFFSDDDKAMLSAVFEVRNYRTGKTSSFLQSYYLKDIANGCHFESGRSLKIAKRQDQDPKGADKD